LNIKCKYRITNSQFGIIVILRENDYSSIVMKLSE